MLSPLPVDDGAEWALDESVLLDHVKRIVEASAARAAIQVDEGISHRDSPAPESSVIAIPLITRARSHQ